MRDKIIPEIIVADSSPLIILAKIEEIELLSKLFNVIKIPSAVADECNQDPLRPGSKFIQQAIQKNVIEIFDDSLIKNVMEFPPVLGKGEIAAINLAKYLTAPLLIDDLMGRKIAQHLKVNVIGTAGILLFAKSKKLIKEVSPLIDKMTDCGFHLSVPLKREILRLAKE